MNELAWLLEPRVGVSSPSLLPSSAEAYFLSLGVHASSADRFSSLQPPIYLMCARHRRPSISSFLFFSSSLFPPLRSKEQVGKTAADRHMRIYTTGIIYSIDAATDAAVRRFSFTAKKTSLYELGARKKGRDGNCCYARIRTFNRIYRGTRAVARKRIMHPFYTTSLLAPLLVSLLFPYRILLTHFIFFYCACYYNYLLQLFPFLPSLTPLFLAKQSHDHLTTEIIHPEMVK